MIMIKDILTDIVAHTHALGFLTTIKITSDDKETVIDSISEDKGVIFNAKIKNPVAEFEGTFGIGNLDKLTLHLKSPEYKENATIDVVKNSKAKGAAPSNLYFENESGDFTNEFRFMATQTINAFIKPLAFKAPNWDVSFTPSVTAIQRLKLQAQVHSDETKFTTTVDNKNLVCSFGDASTHAGNFIFQTSVGKLKNELKWPIQQVLSILNLNGDCTMHISDEGLMMITIDSGLAEYNYILPAQTK
jgi:hypothetical protein